MIRMKTHADAAAEAWLHDVVRALALFAVLCATGCAAYQIGTPSLYDQSIRTVYVPVFESDSLRRGLAEWLTEAVIKEIELKTTYKVVGDPMADSILTGRIITQTKRILVESPTDQPREVETPFTVRVQWARRSGAPLTPSASLPLDPSLIHFQQRATLVPEAGQSIATAHQTTIQRLAEQIVGTMEAPW